MWLLALLRLQGLFLFLQSVKKRKRTFETKLQNITTKHRNGEGEDCWLAEYLRNDFNKVVEKQDSEPKIRVFVYSTTLTTQKVFLLKNSPLYHLFIECSGIG